MFHTKKEIIEHYTKTISYAKELQLLSEAEWRTPVAENKWTIAEIIGHFKAWDEFIVQQRLPYFFQDAQLPKAPDVDQINEQSAKRSREQTKEETISQFVHTRETIIITLQQIDDQIWQNEFYLGEKPYSLLRYFSGHMEHDFHHFNQIYRIVQS